MNILIDKEIDLNQKDLLNTKAYAKSLADIVLNSPVDQAFTIGLFGEWGSGKSSIIKTLNTDLENEKSQKIKFIVYDAWKYANDSFRRMFLLKVQNDLGLEPTELMSSFYVNTNTDTEIKKTFNIPYLTLIVAALLLGLAVFSFFGEPNKATIPAAIILSMLGFLANVFSKAFNEYKVTTQQPHLFAPEQFEACFNEMISKALKKASGIKKVFQYITNTRQGDIDKIIIVIDNIDRCHKDIAYELLTNTKNFIGTGLDVIFLIPVDENALKKHIFKDESAESEEFLRKYFNVTIRIKPYKLTEIFDFASSINEENSLGLQADTINIIAKEYASNPRRIIQFYNNLQLELILFKDKYGEAFIKENEIAICKFLIIREEWNDEYMILCKNPEKFFQEEDPELSRPKNNESFRSFMDATFVSTRSLNYDILQKILINSDNYESLPEVITERIKNKDFDDFVTILTDTGKTKKTVIDYLLFSLEKAVKNSLFTTSVPQVLDQVYIFLSQFSDLDKTYYGRLETEIRRQIDTIIGNTLHPDNLMAFNKSLLKRGMPFMEKSIIKHFNDFNYETDKFLDTPLFELYDAYIIAAEEGQLEVAKKAFPNYLNNTKLKDKVNKSLKPSQLDLLYTSEIIDQYLTDPSIAIWNNTDEKGNWLYLANNLSQPPRLLEPLLKDAERSLTDNPNSALSYITLFDELFSACKNVNPDGALIDLVNTINNSIFAQKRLANHSITKYLEGDEGAMPVSLHYLFECFRVTNGSTSAASWIITYAGFHGEATVKTVLNEFLDSHGESLSFAQLKPFIQSFTETDQLTNTVLLQTLYRSDESTRIYSDEEIKAHFKRMLAEIRSDSSRTPLLLEHAEIELAKPILASVLTELEAEELQLFEPELQEVAFDLIVNDENIGRYKTNFPVLQNIARNGNPGHIKGLLNSIKSNLMDKNYADETLSLILQIKNLDKETAGDLNSFIPQNKIINIADKKLTKDVLEALKKQM
jgi:hypothetical protein